MSKVVAGFKQSTIDVALQTLGDLNSIVSLIVDNNISSVDYDFQGGEVVEFKDNNNSVANLIKERRYKFNTGFPEVQDFRDYSSDYNKDYK